MLTTEFVLMFFSYIQPPLLGILLFIIFKASGSIKYLQPILKNWRKRLKNTKFFECAVQPRLINHIQYDLFILSFCIIFILYDVDLIFFFTEILYINSWTIYELFLVFFNFLLLLFGLWYDYIRLGFNWSY